jgi:hypothetical protein
MSRCVHRPTWFLLSGPLPARARRTARLSLLLAAQLRAVVSDLWQLWAVRAGLPAHGADIYYSGAATPKSLTVPKGMTVPIPEPTSIMEENWDVPPAKSEPGKPIHNARQPQAGQSVSGRKPPPKARPISRPASQYSTVVGSGVRRANHEP